MLTYIFRRLLLMIPTLLLIMLINFIIIQAAPGGPIEQAIAQLTGYGVDITNRITQNSSDIIAQNSISGGQSTYRGAEGLSPEYIAELEERFGFDKPISKRFLIMVGKYLRFDFGESFFQDRSVMQLLRDKLPVSISLGLWTTLIVYIISIPLGIAKAVRDGSAFDGLTTGLIIIGFAIPGFLFAIFLIVFFASGSFFDWFPLRGIVSNNWQDLTWGQKILDYFWHMTLPITALVIGSFAGLTMLTKNSFLDQIHQLYVTTARAKGASEQRVIFAHVFRNAMLVIISGFPAAFIGILFTGSVLIEIIFSLDGLGLLGFEAVFKRDYPVMFATLYIFSLIGLVSALIGDLMYTIVDPRIDFERRN